MHFHRPLLLAVLAASTPALWAQPDTLDVDLGTQRPGTTLTLPTAAGDHVVRIRNRAPRFAYNVSISIRGAEVEPLRRAVLQAREGLALDEACGRLEELSDEVMGAENEAAVAAAMDDLRRYAPTGGCTPQRKREVEAQLKGRTEEAFLVTGLDAGQQLAVVVTRVVESGTAPMWTRTWTTGAKGGWDETYAFVFTLTGPLQETYHLEERAEGGFAITEDRGIDHLAYVPAVLFTWVPAARVGGGGYWSVTGGLGFDLQRPVALFGGGYTFNRNLSVVGGLAFQQMRQLRRRYAPGDVVQENLDEDQLHERVYRPTPFLGLGYRFDASPFQGNDSGPGTGTTPAP